MKTAAIMFIEGFYLFLFSPVMFVKETTLIQATSILLLQILTKQPWSKKCWNAILSCCHMSSAYVDHWDMLNNFCFHVYAQKSLFMCENGNVFFLTKLFISYFSHRARKNQKVFSGGNQIIDMIGEQKLFSMSQWST